MPDVKRRREQMLRWCLPPGLLTGGAIVGFAALPVQMWGVVSFCLIVSVVALSLSVQRRTVVARGRAAGWHTAVFAGAVVSAFILASTAGRGQLIWLSWIAAVVVCAVGTAGSWLNDRPKASNR